MKKTIEEFKGVIPAVLSVFDPQEELDEKGTRELMGFLSSFDIGGLYLTGSTGEAFLMNSEERKRQVEIVMDEVGDRLPVVVHVGAMSTRASVELARHAEAVGAAGISSVPPFYFKFNEEQIFGYYRDLAEATSLPLIVYNIPLAGMMTVSMIERLAALPNVKGVKYTGTALYEVTQIRDACGADFQIYGGCDELGSSNIVLGVDGIIGSFYNCIPDLYLRIWRAVRDSDVETASRLQRKALHVIMLGIRSGSMMACIKLWLRAAEIQRLVRELVELDEREQLTLEIADRIRKTASDGGKIYAF